MPGGPKRISDIGASPSTSRRSGEPGTEQMGLADDLVERARAHPGGQRRVRASVGAGDALDGSTGSKSVIESKMAADLV